MLTAFRLEGDRLAPIPQDAGSLAEEPRVVTLPGDAIWVDLYRPIPEQVAAVAAIAVDVPTLAEMEEIELSNRLYRSDGVDYYTIVMPGRSTTAQPISGPVTFILTPNHLVTVRYHTPQPFLTFPAHSERGAAGCTAPDRIFLSLLDEIVARLADLLEGAGRELDEAARDVFGEDATQDPDQLEEALTRVGRQGELIGRVRLALLTLERALSFYLTRPRPGWARTIVKSLTRDMRALTEHSDYLSSRIGLTVDATLGLINLAQNDTVRIVSVVTVLFLPPTLVASIYGMNFRFMPELGWSWGYPGALGMMVVSALGTYLFFKWKGWL